MTSKSLMPLVAGLLYMSETDAPLVPVTLPPMEDPLPQLLLLTGRPGGDSVEETAPAHFLRRHTKGNSPEAARWRALLELLQNELSHLTVYRLGTVSIDAFLIGRNGEGGWVGVSTKLVET